MEIMIYELECPEVVMGKKCSGILQYLGCEETCIGNINGTDPNLKNESWSCNICGSFFSRVYKWRKEGNF